ncbi:MAG: DUF1080 domain-containing protein [Planctomycetota bacterium]|nr:MAG: DUF1080 domain-containing protein [Planctomycetota bacterium]
MSTKTLPIATLVFCGWFSGCHRATPPPSPVTAVQTPLPVPAVVEPTFEVETGFRLIPFTEMNVFPADSTTANSWRAEGEEFLSTGKPKCYLHTTQSTGNGIWRYDFRFEPDPALTDPLKLNSQNTGVLFFIQEPHAIWPASIEVQGRHSEMGQLRPNGGTAAVEFQDLSAVRETARHPVGEWNSVEVVIVDGALTVTLNGHVIAIGQPGPLQQGLVGLQAEGHRIRYRRLRYASSTK